MKRKLISVLLVLCLILSLSVTAAALDPIRRFTDRANLVPDSEESHALEYRLSVISQKYQMEVAILTVDSLGGKSATAYADDYYDSQGYGWGPKNSGLLLLISIEEREWYVSTCGDAIEAVTDYEIDSMFSGISGMLSAGEYYEAFNTFLTEIEVEYQAHTDDNTLDSLDIIIRLAIALGIGAVIAGIALLVMRSRMNTAKQQTGAESYIVGGSYDLYRYQDFFLYSQTTKTPKPQNNSSSTHRSSSGRSHGGRGGRF